MEGGTVARSQRTARAEYLCRRGNHRLGENVGTLPRCGISLWRRAVVQSSRLRAEPRGPSHATPAQNYHPPDGCDRRTGQPVPARTAGSFLHSRFAPGPAATGLHGFKIPRTYSPDRNNHWPLVGPAPNLGWQTRVPLGAVRLAELRRRNGQPSSRTLSAIDDGFCAGECRARQPAFRAIGRQDCDPRRQCRRRVRPGRRRFARVPAGHRRSAETEPLAALVSKRIGCLSQRVVENRLGR